MDMKMLLTSTGLSNQSIVDAFISLVGKRVEEIKVAFVPTAAINESEKKYVEISKKELLGLGIKDKNIVVIDVDDGYSVQRIKECDAMYVCGGNTFYLLNEIRKHGLGEVLKIFLERGGVYVGVSAGSIVVTPSIAVAEVEPADENEVGLANLNGLGLVDFEVCPHVPEIVLRKDFEGYSRLAKNKVYALDHKTALEMDGEVVRFVR